MANEEDKTVVQTDDQANDSKDKSKPGKAGGFKKLLLFGSIGVGVIVLGVFLAVFVIKPMTSSKLSSLICMPPLQSNKVDHRLKIKSQLPLHLLFVNVTLGLVLLEVYLSLPALTYQIHRVPLTSQPNSTPRRQLVRNVKRLFL